MLSSTYRGTQWEKESVEDIEGQREIEEERDRLLRPDPVAHSQSGSTV